MKPSQADKTSIKKHVPVLRTVSRVGKKRRDSILKNAPPSFFTTLKRIARLLVRGGIKLTDRDRKKLSPTMKTVLRRIHGAKNIKNTVVQHGDGLSGVLRVVLPLIGGLIGI